MTRKRSSPQLGLELAVSAMLACIVLLPVLTQAAPLSQDATEIQQYSEGCYYNYNHYNEGDRISTNEPCLNCTCHNKMLMCYLRVCPFTKPIGHDCIVEKREDQCCPIITCPEVPVDVAHHTSEPGTELSFPEKFGCSIDEKFYPEGAQVPSNPNKPCELCYCIKNRTSCLMQECTLHIDGCQPIYNKGSCCPVRYNCDHENDILELEDHSTTTTTTVRPTPGYVLTTTMTPSVSMDCVHNGEVYADGASISGRSACEHCYCMRGDIVCAVQECEVPMLAGNGKSCHPVPASEGECCPSNYVCEDDSATTQIIEAATVPYIEEEGVFTTSAPVKDLHSSVSQEDIQLQTHIDDDEKLSTDAPETVAEVKPVDDVELGSGDDSTESAEDIALGEAATSVPILDEADKQHETVPTSTAGFIAQDEIVDDSTSSTPITELDDKLDSATTESMEEEDVSVDTTAKIPTGFASTEKEDHIDVTTSKIATDAAQEDISATTVNIPTASESVEDVDDVSVNIPTVTQSAEKEDEDVDTATVKIPTVIESEKDDEDVAAVTVKIPSVAQTAEKEEEEDDVVAQTVKTPSASEGTDAEDNVYPTTATESTEEEEHVEETTAKIPTVSEAAKDEEDISVTTAKITLASESAEDDIIDITTVKIPMASESSEDEKYVDNATDKIQTTSEYDEIVHSTTTKIPTASESSEEEIVDNATVKIQTDSGEEEIVDATTVKIATASESSEVEDNADNATVKIPTASGEEQIVDATTVKIATASESSEVEDNVDNATVKIPTASGEEQIFDATTVKIPTSSESSEEEIVDVTTIKISMAPESEEDDIIESTTVKIPATSDSEETLDSTEANIQMEHESVDQEITDDTVKIPTSPASNDDEFIEATTVKIPHIPESDDEIVDSITSKIPEPADEEIIDATTVKIPIASESEDEEIVDATTVMPLSESSHEIVDASTVKIPISSDAFDSDIVDTTTVKLPSPSEIVDDEIVDDTVTKSPTTSESVDEDLSESSTVKISESSVSSEDEIVDTSTVKIFADEMEPSDVEKTEGEQTAEHTTNKFNIPEDDKLSVTTEKLSPTAGADIEDQDTTTSMPKESDESSEQDKITEKLDVIAPSEDEKEDMSTEKIVSSEEDKEDMSTDKIASSEEDKEDMSTEKIGSTDEETIESTTVKKSEDDNIKTDEEIHTVKPVQIETDESLEATTAKIQSIYSENIEDQEVTTFETEAVKEDVVTTAPTHAADDVHAHTISPIGEQPIIETEKEDIDVMATPAPAHDAEYTTVTIPASSEDNKSTTQKTTDIAHEDDSKIETTTYGSIEKVEQPDTSVEEQDKPVDTLAQEEEHDIVQTTISTPIEVITEGEDDQHKIMPTIEDHKLEEDDMAEHTTHLSLDQTTVKIDVSVPAESQTSTPEQSIDEQAFTNIPTFGEESDSSTDSIIPTEFGNVESASDTPTDIVQTDKKQENETAEYTTLSSVDVSSSATVAPIFKQDEAKKEEYTTTTEETGSDVATDAPVIVDDASEITAAPEIVSDVDEELEKIADSAVTTMRPEVIITDASTMTPEQIDITSQTPELVADIDEVPEKVAGTDDITMTPEIVTDADIDTLQPEKIADIDSTSATTVVPGIVSDADEATLAPETLAHTDEITVIPEIVTMDAEQSTERSDSIEDQSLENIFEMESIPIVIPGEGDCLVGQKTYQNNSILPSSDECELSCRCVSSIVVCQRIECQIPENVEKCVLDEAATDKCCPTYICGIDSMPTKHESSESSEDDDEDIKYTTFATPVETHIASSTQSSIDDTIEKDTVQTPTQDIDEQPVNIPTDIEMPVFGTEEPMSHIKDDLSATDAPKIDQSAIATEVPDMYETIAPGLVSTAKPEAEEKLDVDTIPHVDTEISSVEDEIISQTMATLGGKPHDVSSTTSSPIAETDMSSTSTSSPVISDKESHSEESVTEVFDSADFTTAIPISTNEPSQIPTLSTESPVQIIEEEGSGEQAIVTESEEFLSHTAGPSIDDAEKELVAQTVTPIIGDDSDIDHTDSSVTAEKEEETTHTSLAQDETEKDTDDITMLQTVAPTDVEENIEKQTISPALAEVEDTTFDQTTVSSIISDDKKTTDESQHTIAPDFEGEHDITGAQTEGSTEESLGHTISPVFDDKKEDAQTTEQSVSENEKETFEAYTIAPVLEDEKETTEATLVYTIAPSDEIDEDLAHQVTTADEDQEIMDSQTIAPKMDDKEKDITDETLVHTTASTFTSEADTVASYEDNAQTIAPTIEGEHIDDVLDHTLIPTVHEDIDESLAETGSPTDEDEYTTTSSVDTSDKLTPVPESIDITIAQTPSVEDMVTHLGDETVDDAFAHTTAPSVEDKTIAPIADDTFAQTVAPSVEDTKVDSTVSPIVDVVMDHTIVPGFEDTNKDQFDESVESTESSIVEDDKKTMDDALAHTMKPSLDHKDVETTTISTSVYDDKTPATVEEDVEIDDTIAQTDGSLVENITEKTVESVDEQTFKPDIEGEKDDNSFVQSVTPVMPLDEDVTSAVEPEKEIDDVLSQTIAPTVEDNVNIDEDDSTALPNVEDDTLSHTVAPSAGEPTIAPTAESEKDTIEDDLSHTVIPSEENMDVTATVAPSTSDADETLAHTIAPVTDMGVESVVTPIAGIEKESIVPVDEEKESIDDKLAHTIATPVEHNTAGTFDESLSYTIAPDFESHEETVDDTLKATIAPATDDMEEDISESTDVPTLDNTDDTFVQTSSPSVEDISAELSGSTEQTIGTQTDITDETLDHTTATSINDQEGDIVDDVMAHTVVPSLDDEKDNVLPTVSSTMDDTEKETIDESLSHTFAPIDTLAQTTAAPAEDKDVIPLDVESEQSYTSAPITDVEKESDGTLAHTIVPAIDDKETIHHTIAPSSEIVDEAVTESDSETIEGDLAHTTVPSLEDDTKKTTLPAVSPAAGTSVTSIDEISVTTERISESDSEEDVGEESHEATTAPSVEEAEENITPVSGAKLQPPATEQPETAEDSTMAHVDIETPIVPAVEISEMQTKAPATEEATTIVPSVSAGLESVEDSGESVESEEELTTEGQKIQHIGEFVTERVEETSTSIPVTSTDEDSETKPEIEASGEEGEDMVEENVSADKDVPSPTTVTSIESSEASTSLPTVIESEKDQDISMPTKIDVADQVVESTTAAPAHDEVEITTLVPTIHDEIALDSQTELPETPAQTPAQVEAVVDVETPVTVSTEVEASVATPADIDSSADSSTEKTESSEESDEKEGESAESEEAEQQPTTVHPLFPHTMGISSTMQPAQIDDRIDATNITDNAQAPGQTAVKKDENVELPTISTSTSVPTSSSIAETPITPATAAASPQYPAQPPQIYGQQPPQYPSYPEDEYTDEEDTEVFGPGTCRYGGKLFVSAQQIPRDDPCDFCFCFRSDIICLQQSCPPPISGCHEEPISGFCCPRYECPVSMATVLNITTSTTTTSTTLPPHFLHHAYDGAAEKNGCHINGRSYRVGEKIDSASGPCMHCTCGGDGQMKCDPKTCSPEPMLRQMIAVVASRRR